jgi:type IV pilus assembly protein PilF
MYGIYALVYAEEGDIDLADENFRRSLRLDRTDAQTRNNYAAFLFAHERYPEAYDNLEIVVQDTEYPGRALAFENLGLTALRLDSVEDAKRAFTRAVQLNRGQLRSLTELTDLLIDEGDFTGAEGYYQSIVDIATLYSQIQLTPRNLLQGITIARATGDADKITLYSQQLGTSFPNSREYQIYQQSLINE